LATESGEAAREIFGGRDAHAACGDLLDDLMSVNNLGDAALSLWAAALLEHEGASRALACLRLLDPVGGPHPTVEIAWAVTALSLLPDRATDPRLRQATADRLMGCYRESSGAFAHWPAGVPHSALRGHVCCFADLVYPVQALSYYHRATGDERAIELARRCGQFMCDTQGPAGQWWWHFDVRTGRVVEGYPVYAVHQDAMAPMALFALHDACGADHSRAIERGVEWLEAAPELNGASLIDPQADLIWRKVARHEPGKLSRGLQALASRMHRGLRVPGLGAVFRPGRIDFECRPYHLGWILHAWTAQRLQRWTAAEPRA